MRRLPSEDWTRPMYSPAGGGLTAAGWIHWEIRRYLDLETPGRHGSFTAEDAK